MVAFKYRMPAGIPGALNRVGQSTVESQIMNTAKPVTKYGVPVKLVAGKIEPLEAGDAASVVYGFLVRPYPTHSGQGGLGEGTPNPVDIANVMRRGYMTVYVQNGTGAKDGTVYVRVADPTSDHPIGGLETTADSGDCVAISLCKWMGPADANGNTEISFNI